MATEGGLNQEAIGALTGFPVFGYDTVVGDTNFFNTMLAAYSNQYILAATTGAGSDSTNNICNIANGHAYSILAVFNITATNGTLLPVFNKDLEDVPGTLGPNGKPQQKIKDSFWESTPLVFEDTPSPIEKPLIVQADGKTIYDSKTAVISETV